MLIAGRGKLVAMVLLACGASSTGFGSTAADEASTAKPRIVLHTASETAAARFDVAGLTDRQLSAFGQLSPEQRSDVFAVFVDGDLDDPPPIVGSLLLEKGVLRFTPRYPLEPGLSYRAVFDRGKLLPDGADSRDVVSATFPIAKPNSRPTTVVGQIYPTSDRLPDNQLKFYIHFSAPMSRGEAYRHIHLLDAAGKELDAVFLELGEELWDGRGQRFTLFFDPGRVKRGLKPREELGPILHEGRRYTLVIDDDWRDASRLPLKSGAKKTFWVGPPDLTPVDPAKWKVQPPAAGSAAPLIVHFGESLDHSQLLRVMRVATASGRGLAGKASVSDHESRWQFTPARTWKPGKYQLIAETTLEDLAGNSIGRPFEVDQFGPISKRVETETVSIPFTVAPR